MSNTRCVITMSFICTGLAPYPLLRRRVNSSLISFRMRCDHQSWGWALLCEVVVGNVCLPSNIEAAIAAEKEKTESLAQETRSMLQGSESGQGLLDAQV